MAPTSPIDSSASNRRRLRVGLTGGIGSGKSVVADQLAAHGAAIVDTDVIARQLTQPNGRAIAHIRRTFGDDVLDDTGGLDRAKMRQRVFGDPTERKRLEAILHPLIRQQAVAMANEAAAAPYVVLAVPLLVESGDWGSRVERVLVVDSTTTDQIRRVVTHRGLPMSQVQAIVAQQASRAQRLAVADDVLINAGTVAQLAPRVMRLHRLYCTLARSLAAAAGPL